MKLSVKKILGTSLALGLAAGNLGAQSASQFGNLPLWFEAGSSTQFTAHASDSEFCITPTGAEFTLAKTGGETASCQLQFVGANPSAHISGAAPLTGTINYFLGSNPNQWRAGVPTYAQVRVENIYPGVNVVYYGNRQNLEYDFNLAAGVNPSVIALHFAGAEKISVDAQGALVINFNTGRVIQHPPLAYQTVRGTRQEIAASYKILDAHTAVFALGDYNRDEPLVIDPILSYSSYFGGNLGEIGWAVAVNPTDGSIYVAGQTFSSKITNGIPFSTAGAYQTNYLGGKQAGDAFVARFNIESDTNGAGTNLSLIYATYLGGSADDAAYAIAVDPAGNAFIAGATISTNFPVKNPIAGGNKINGKINPHLNSYPTDAFVSELDSSGSNLVYSTYIGGESSEAAYGIALDADDNAYITGFTYSTNFPVTPDAFQSHLMCSNTFYINANAFVSEISTNGPTLNYSTYLGGTNFDEGHAIAYNSGKIFVAGYTFSTNFPSINHLPAMATIYTNYYTKKEHGVLVTTNSVWTNYFSGEHLNDSTNKNNDASDAFVTGFDTTVQTNWTLLYSTYLGGTNDDRANGIAADANGNAYVVGYTCSTNFPNTTFGLTSSYVFTNGLRYEDATNGFITQILYNAGTNATIGYSAMFGGRGVDVANGVALDPDGNAYVIGSASSTNFPVTTNFTGYLSTTNHYIRKRFRSDVVVIVFNPDASALLYSCYLGGTDNDYGNAIAVDQFANAYIVGQTLSTNFPVTLDSSNSISALQTHRNGTNDMFMSIISPN